MEPSETEPRMEPAGMELTENEEEIQSYKRDKELKAFKLWLLYKLSTPEEWEYYVKYHHPDGSQGLRYSN